MITQAMDAVLEEFALEVGDTDPVTCVGGRTQWGVGGLPSPEAREVHAPSGVVTFEPAEMTVRVRAGTTVGALDAVLAEGGQMVPLDPAVAARATVGGVLAVGRSGVRRLRYGPIRDVLLEARYVSAEGRLIKAGGPTVKNVSGFDLCRLLVGSLGTLGLMAQVVLRCRPLPVVSRWLAGETDPFALLRQLYRPSSILWDGTTTWVLLEGHPADVEASIQILGPGFSPVDAPPPGPPAAFRRSLPPAALASLVPADGAFLAEIGVGTVQTSEPRPQLQVEGSTLELNKRVKSTFDPAGRLNPGRTVMAP